MNECLILIADDDCEWVDRVERKLRKDYQQIQTATEVTAALDKIQNGLFDIIFCDIQMRYQDKGGVAKDDGGFQLAHSALDLIPDVKVVMITAYGSSSYIRQSFKGGAFDYLEKSLEGTKYDIIAMRDITQEILREKEQTPISPNPFIIEEGKLPKYFLSRRSAQACAPDYNTFISKLFMNL